MFFYVYVLESLKDTKLYIGYTNNLKRRLEEHNKGLSFATKFRLPFKLIYFEGCLNIDDVKRREHYLKTTQGRRFLGLRLIEYKHQKTAFDPSPVVNRSSTTGSGR
ncbi:MAG: GIY-YIG nuclease family protein [bacterium]|nr:GIY-YIG nuclease family protein [bacterium]